MSSADTLIAVAMIVASSIFLLYSIDAPVVELDSPWSSSVAEERSEHLATAVNTNNTNNIQPDFPTMTLMSITSVELVIQSSSHNRPLQVRFTNSTQFETVIKAASAATQIPVKDLSLTSDIHGSQLELTSGRLKDLVREKNIHAASGSKIVLDATATRKRSVSLNERTGTTECVKSANELVSSVNSGSSLKPKIPRVMIISIGSGRYREFAIEALLSGQRHFGGDCITSFHLLTDNTSGVREDLNPQHIPYRPWPESGLSKYEDMKEKLGPILAKDADYFYFMDADVKFNDRVTLADIAGDLVGVEHPMYPRDNEGWCYRQDGQPMCAFPYDRNPSSMAFIPEQVGKFFHTTTGGKGVVRKYLVSTFWYFQSAFWGGKKAHILYMLNELARRVDVDRKAHRYSQTVQDERYFNFWMWKQSKNSSINIRVLSHSYLYPFRSDGFGDWVTKKHRPIIYHGTKVPGKLTLGEVDIGVMSTNVCLGYFLNPQVGLFGCHHGGGMQGWIAENANGSVVDWPSAPNIRVRFRQATTNHKWSQCLGGDVNPGSPAKLPLCSNGGEGILWIYDSSNRLKNIKSGLCIDAMTKPPHKREPLLVQPCSDSVYQNWKITVIGSVECKQKWCKKEGDTPDLTK